MASEPVVSLRGVEFTRPGGSFRLRVESLEVRAGEALALVGPSGCGKTTLLHLAAGILVAGAGEVRTLGTGVSGLAEGARRRLRLERIGMVFQELELLDYLSARENILTPGWLVGARGDGARGARVASLAARAGIAHLMGRRPAELSQGERQRVAVCRALAHEPGLVLCDEPTGNLDGASAARVIEMVVEEARTRGAGVIVVTHDPAAASRMDRVVDVGGLAEGARA